MWGCLCWTHTYWLITCSRLQEWTYQCQLCIVFGTSKRIWPVKNGQWIHQHTPQHIPIAIYGDACTVRGNIKVLGIFLSFPLWRAKSTRCSRWLVCALEEAKLWGTETLNTIFKRITFSLNMLFNGWDVERDVQLAGGRIFTVTELRGDWLWHKQCWNFSSSLACNEKHVLPMWL